MNAGCTNTPRRRRAVGAPAIAHPPLHRVRSVCAVPCVVRATELYRCVICRRVAVRHLTTFGWRVWGRDVWGCLCTEHECASEPRVGRALICDFIISNAGPDQILAVSSCAG